MNIFICHTIYHLLISLCKIDFNKENKFILLDTINNREEIKNKINNELEKKCEFIFLSNKTKSKNINLKFNLNDNIYIFNDCTQIGQYLRKNKINYNLIEDGFNYHRKEIRYYLIFICRIISSLRYQNIPFGFSKYCKSIEINDISLVNKDKRYSKFVEINRKNLLLNLSEIRKNKILKIFNVKPIENQTKKSILILTQPIFNDRADSKITSKISQFEYYNNIVKKYEGNYKVYLKPHPRDNVDYSEMKNVLLLEKNIPMELYEFIGDYKFEIGITHSSTAIYFLECINKKIVMSKKFNYFS